MEGNHTFGCCTNIAGNVLKQQNKEGASRQYESMLSYDAWSLEPSSRRLVVSVWSMTSLHVVSPAEQSRYQSVTYHFMIVLKARLIHRCSKEITEEKEDLPCMCSACGLHEP